MGGLILLGCLDNALEVFRPFRPGERGWILAVFLQVLNQEILQVLLGALYALRECLPRENAEEALNHIHPRGVRCGVVKMHARVAEATLWRLGSCEC